MVSFHPPKEIFYSHGYNFKCTSRQIKMFRRKKPSRSAVKESSRPLSQISIYCEGDLQEKFEDLSQSRGGDISLSQILREENKPQENKPYLREEELRNTLYYLASLIPKRDFWLCHFEGTSPQNGDYTKSESSLIRIKATITRETESLVLLPFGEQPVWCSFPGNIEFVFSSKQGEGVIEAIHVCEKGVHKLILPEEISLQDKLYNIRDVLPLTLTH